MRAGYDAALDECAGAARRIPPRDRAAAGALCRRDRRQVAEDPAQQRARLFRRGDGAARREADGARRSTRPSSIARRWPGRCASPPPSSASWRRRSPAPPTARSASSSRSSSGSRALVVAAERRDQGRRRGARACSMSRRRWRRSRSSATMCARRSTIRSTSSSRADAIRWSSRRCARWRAVRRQRLRSLAAERTRARAHLAADRPEHGGQVDLPAPERADRRARADGQLRAGEARRSIGVVDRAVLARRRRRRSRARALDLHGRDGRDRGDPQPGGRALAGHPRRDRARHRDLRRPLDRLGGDRASARAATAAARCSRRISTS